MNALKHQLGRKRDILCSPQVQVYSPASGRLPGTTKGLSCERFSIFRSYLPGYVRFPKHIPQHCVDITNQVLIRREPFTTLCSKSEPLRERCVESVVAVLGAQELFLCGRGSRNKHMAYLARFSQGFMESIIVGYALAVAADLRIGRSNHFRLKKPSYSHVLGTVARS